MKSNIIRYVSIICGLVFSATSGMAQNLNESLTVEGTYTPEQIDADRLSVSPTLMSLTAPQSSLNYDRGGVAANFSPDALSMPATGWRATKLFDTSRGYLDFRIGSWLNSSLSMGYAAIDEPDTRLRLRLQHNSTSLWQAWTKDLEKDVWYSADNRFRYDETIGGDFSHRIAGCGELRADLQYHLGYFNYYTAEESIDNDDKLEAPKQVINDLYAAIGWAGENTGPLSYRVEADIRYFGYRSAYMLSSGAVMIYDRKGQREAELNAGGNIAFALGKKNKVGIDITYTGLYNTNREYYDNRKLDINRFRIVPAFEYSNGNTSMRIGAELAVVDAQESKFRIAPDVKFNARSGVGAVSVSIGGGTHLRTLAWMHEMDYYSSPLYVCDNAAYSPIDARVAFQLNPGGKWTLGVEGLWRTTLNETLGGWYQASIDFPTEPRYEDYYPAHIRLSGFSVGVNAGYEFSRYIGLNGRFNWQPQHEKRGVLNGFDRPAITTTLSAVSKPIEALQLRLDYNLRAKRYLLKGNVSRLDLTADYKLTEKLTLGGEICNLLNRHEMLLPGVPSEGITAAAGLQLLF